MRTMVTGRYVIGWDQESADFEIHRDGAVVYEGDTITYVGAASNYGGAEPEETIDGGNCIVSPGFIDMNALGDIDHHLIFADFPAQRSAELQWSAEYFESHPEEQLPAADEDFKSLYAYINLIRNGTTTAMPITGTIHKRAGETYRELAAAAGHAERLGLRVYLGPSYLAGKHVIDPDSGHQVVRLFEGDEAQLADRGLADAERFIQEFDGAAAGLIRGCVVPERIELLTEDLILRSKELARRYDVPIRLHAAQSVYDYDFCMEASGMSPVAYLDSLGFLDSRTLIPHGYAMSGFSQIADQSDDDLDIMRDRGSSVIHCPIVQARWGNRLETFGRYVRHGINLCMGTDTWPVDILEHCRVGSFVARILDGNQPEDQFAQFFRALTLGGARALGREDLGRLAPGCKADLVIIDQTAPEYGVQMDPVLSLMTNGTGRDVRTSIINGRVVMRDRQIQGIDDAELLERAQAAHDRMAESYIRRSPTPEAFLSQFYPSTFPIR